MKRCRITALRQTVYKDLSDLYENKLEIPCTIDVGDVFFSAGSCPQGFCESAWESLKPFVLSLIEGNNNFYDGWMKDPDSALVSCNDGFRPMSFYIKLEDY